MLQISGSFVSLLITWMQNNDVSSDKIHKSAALLSKNNLVDIERWNSLLTQAANEFNQDNIGFELGELVSIKNAGVLGYLMASADSTFEAIQIYQRSEQRFYNTNWVDVKTQKNQLIVSWHLPFTHGQELAIQASISAFTHFLQTLFPLSYQIIEIESCLTQQQQLDRFASFYHCSVATNPEYFKLKFNLQQSKIVQPIGHDFLSINLSNSESSELTNKLIKILKSQLPLANHSINEVAKLTHQSPRSLQRRLQRQNMSYQYLLDSIREQLACLYLEQNQLSGTDIALMLGFSEHSAFVRAFKQWKSMSPSKYKSTFNKLL